MPHDLETRLLAFGYYTAREVVESDGVYDASELAFLDATWPRAQLQSHGLVDAAGTPTSELYEAYLEARGTLALEASMKQRLGVLSLLLKASVSDEHLDYNEGGVLFAAADVLDVPHNTLLAHMDTMDEVGDLDLPTPEDDLELPEPE